jgi:Homeodomain-like domain
VRAGEAGAFTLALLARWVPPALPKILDRYKEHGLEALSDPSRRPVRFANQLPAQLEARITAFKGDKRHWGARKIRELTYVACPATSTCSQGLFLCEALESTQEDFAFTAIERPFRERGLPDAVRSVFYRNEG